MYLSIYLSIYVSINLSIYLYLYLSIYISIYLFIYVSIESRKSGDLVQLNVLTVTAEYGTKNFSSTLPTPRGFSTLPRKPGGRTPLQHPPPPPRRDPATTLSVGRARAKSMVANLAAMDTLRWDLLLNTSFIFPKKISK